jgi:hypothetical protein
VRKTVLTLLILALTIAGTLSPAMVTTSKGRRMAKLTLKSAQSSKTMSPLMFATYLKRTGVEMIKGSSYTESTGTTILIQPGEEFMPNAFVSRDNGRAWTRLPANPDFDRNLPHGYRREAFPIFVDPVNGKIIKVVPSMDTPGLDPSLVEPSVALEAYYLRYRVSNDGGKTFLFDEPIVQKGKTPENPFDNVYRGKNGIFMGDVGSQLLRTRQGRILIPAQACKLGPDGKLWSPGGGFTYTDVIMILGRWVAGDRLEWEISQPIEGDPARSTRGMIEPTVAEMPDGRLLCVMRGSNGGSKDPEFKLPSYKWFSVSTDGGYRWTKPEPWTYDDGTPFYSPSAMSQLLKHSSGRYFWIGNINETNSQGNNWRYPLMIGEVDPKSLRLVKSTLLLIDTKRPEEPGLNLSHWWGLEDRETKEIVIVGARFSQDYNMTSPIVYRIGVE